MAFCPNCGAPLRDNDRFCGKCGHALSAQGEDRNLKSQPAPHRPGSQKSRTPLFVAIACVVVAAIVVFALMNTLRPKTDGASGANAGAPGSSEAATGAEATTKPEVPAEESKGPAVSYSWSNDVLGTFGVDKGEGGLDVWFPVFSADQESFAQAVDAINGDVHSRTQVALDIFTQMVVSKPWISVSLYPEVTYSDDRYVAVYYYHVYNMGTVGTYDAGGGECAIYDLTDGSQVSPAQLLGLEDQDLIARAKDALATCGNQALASNATSLDDMMQNRTASFVVLGDGVYLYLKTVTPGDSTGKPMFSLVGICGFNPNEQSSITGSVIDHGSDEQIAHYRDLDRTGTTAL